MNERTFSDVSQAVYKIFRLRLKAALNTDIQRIVPQESDLFTACQLPRTGVFLDILSSLKQSSRTVLIDRLSMRWQVLCLTDGIFLAGPYRASRMDEMPKAEVLQLMDSRSNLLPSFINYFSALPVLEDDTVLQILASAAGVLPESYYDRFELYDLRVEQQNDLHPDHQYDRPIQRRDREFDYMHAVGTGNVEAAKAIVLDIFKNYRQIMAKDPQAVLHGISTCAVYRTMARTAARQAGVPATLLDVVTNRYRMASIRMIDAFDIIDLVQTMTDEICRLVDTYRHCSYTGPVRQAACYVDMCFRQELSVTSIADRLQIQQSRLSAEFVRQTGMSLTDYITQRRLEYASSLLRLSDEPVTTICQQSGFSDCSYFTKLFRKAYGVTPTAYRQNRE